MDNYDTAIDAIGKAIFDPNKKTSECLEVARKLDIEIKKMIGAICSSQPGKGT